jgi:hypothetical protein
MTPEQRMEYSKPIFVPKDSQGVFTRDGAMSGGDQGSPAATAGAATAPAPGVAQGGSLDPHAFFKAFVLPHEGGLNAHDANGAPTNFGINQAANPGVDVTKLTPDRAADIFANKYYAASGAQHLPPALAAVHADTYFINPGAATRILAQSGGDPQKYLQLREAWMQHDLQTNPAVRPYAKAWAARNSDLTAYANRLAAGDAGTSGLVGAPGAQTAGAVPQPSIPGFHFTPFGAGEADAGGGHKSTPAELAKAGLPTSTVAWTNPKGQIVDMPKGIAEQAETGGPIMGDATKSGAAYVATLGADKDMVQAMIDGRVPWQSASALRNPDVLRMQREATHADPTLNAGTAPARAALWKSMTSGPDSVKITAINQALFHATNLANDVDALNNVAVPIVGNAINWAKNAVQNPTTGAETAYRTDATALGTEAAKAFQGGVPHEGEVKQWTSVLGDPNASPVEQRMALQHLTGLLQGALQATQSKFQAGIGKMGSSLQVIHPDAAEAYQRLSTLQSHFSQAGAPQGAPPRPRGQGGAPQEFDFDPRTGRMVPHPGG